MKKEKIKGFISGFIFCCLLLVFTMRTFASPVAKVLNVTYNNIKVVVDGVPVEFGKDSTNNSIEPLLIMEPLIYLLGL